MQGAVERGEDGQLAPACGLILRVFEQLFQRISDEEQEKGLDTLRYSVKCRCAARCACCSAPGLGRGGEAARAEVNPCTPVFYSAVKVNGVCISPMPMAQPPPLHTRTRKTPLFCSQLPGDLQRSDHGSAQASLHGAANPGRRHQAGGVRGGAVGDQRAQPWVALGITSCRWQATTAAMRGGGQGPGKRCTRGKQLLLVGGTYAGGPAHARAYAALLHSKERECLSLLAALLQPRT